MISWDEPKRAKNIESHGWDFAALSPDFFAEAKIAEATLWAPTPSAQIAADPDNYESTDEELAQAKPMAEALPELHAALMAEIAKRKAGRPKAAVTKQTIAIRLDPDVLEAFKATGPGWQTRMNEALREWIERQRAA